MEQKFIAFTTIIYVFQIMNEYSDFKPVDRSRAYTWHGSHSGMDSGHNTTSKFAVTVQTYHEDSGSSSVSQSSKKPWSRRNAWGSMSYADLIGKAIESTVDKRMTLAQIYDWMIQNVPYFHDKGSGNSSTGWKVRNFFPYTLQSFHLICCVMA